MSILQPNERRLESLRALLSLMVTLFLLSASAGGELAWSAGSAAKIKVVYSSFSGSSVPIWIAQERRLFNKHGLKADLVFATGRRPTQALVAGDVQFISTAASASIPAAVAGATLLSSLDQATSARWKFFRSPISNGQSSFAESVSASRPSVPQRTRRHVSHCPSGD
jgi:ABC-type nitrate/sulfonate/bicarbonate transport system substrate-binding protein